MNSHRFVINFFIKIFLRVMPADPYIWYERFHERLLTAVCTPTGQTEHY